MHYEYYSDDMIISRYLDEKWDYNMTVDSYRNIHTSISYSSTKHVDICSSLYQYEIYSTNKHSDIKGDPDLM